MPVEELIGIDGCVKMTPQADISTCVDICCVLFAAFSQNKSVVSFKMLKKYNCELSVSSEWCETYNQYSY